MSPYSCLLKLQATFVLQGSHEKLLLCYRVASFAVTALRQLAAKLLVRADRADLTSFSHQDEALRPFVSVLKHCESAAVREQVVHSIAQTITAHPRGLGSGQPKTPCHVYQTHQGVMLS